MQYASCGRILRVFPRGLAASEMSKKTNSIVALVRGPIVSTTRAINNEATPCVAFAYIAAYLRQYGHDVAIVDAIAEGLNKFWPLADRPGFRCQGLTFKETVERIPAHADVIGFSGMFSGEWPILRPLIEHTRERFPDALIVVGGEHATALTEYTLRDCPAIDVCVRGEGERTFYELIDSYRKGGRYGQVDGIAFLDDEGAYRQVPGLPRIRDADSIPWPWWPDGYLEKFWAAGKSYGVHSERDMPLMASRGCPYQCTFCSSPQMWTTRYVLRDIDDVVAEIRSYIDRFDITALQFYDLTMIMKKDWTIAFCEKLLEKGIKLRWSLPSGTRSEALDAQTLDVLSKTGCDYLVYAPESGSPDTLKRIKKRIDLGRLTASVLEAKHRGIVVRTNLIIGFPHETRRNIFETIRYGLYLALRGVDEVSINIFSPYPGTEIFRELLEKQRIHLNDQYFLSLSSLNSDYTALDPLTVNDHVGRRELAFYRIIFMVANYAVGYVIRPSRIIRTIRALLFDTRTATVLEHRLKDALKREKIVAS